MPADQHHRVNVRSVARRIAGAIRVYGYLSKAEYRLIVEERIATLAAKQVLDAQVYPLSMGAFPIMVKEVLDALANRVQRAPFTSAGREGYPAEPAPWEHDELDIVDSQWYFDVPSVQRIISCFPNGTRSLVALGTPTVAAMAVPTVPEVTLVDISPRFMTIGRPAWLDVQRVERVTHDLNVKTYDGVTDADVVVMDPPWYVESYRAWLDSAMAVCKLGGLIAVALPQLLTNSRSLPERREIIQRLDVVGRVSIRRNALTYVSPSFELAVLETGGLAFLRRWRHADLALVEVGRGSGRRRAHHALAEGRPRNMPEHMSPLQDMRWSYREILGQVVRTCFEKPPDGSLPLIAPLDPEDGYRLTGVGRSYLWASEPDLITSRGRAAKVAQWGELPRILDLLQSGDSPDSAISQALPDVSCTERGGLAATLRTILEH